MYNYRGHSECFQTLEVIFLFFVFLAKVLSLVFFLSVLIEYLLADRKIMQLQIVVIVYSATGHMVDISDSFVAHICTYIPIK